MSALEFLSRETEMCSTLNHPLCGCATIVIQKSPFHYNRGVQAAIRERKGDFMAKQTNSLAHTKWMCKYHIIFTPKYRRKIVYNQYKTDLRDILKCRITIYVWQTYIYKNFGIFFRRVVNTILFWFSNAGI